MAGFQSRRLEIGHNGTLPGYETVAVYLLDKQLTLVILTNTDIHYRGADRKHGAGRRHHSHYSRIHLCLSARKSRESDRPSRRRHRRMRCRPNCSTTQGGVRPLTRMLFGASRALPCEG